MLLIGKVEEGRMVEFPVTFEALRVRFPQTMYALPLTADQLPEGYVQVLPVAAPVSVNQRVQQTMPVLTQQGWMQAWALVDNTPAELDAEKKALAAEIDAAVAAITARYAPYLEEYKTRETQARAFAAANYTGTVPQQVAAFATPAGITAQEATATIIGQADGLRTASDLLGVQRMRKYEVLRAATAAQARAAHANVIATIAAIGAQIG